MAATLLPGRLGVPHVTLLRAVGVVAVCWALALGITWLALLMMAGGAGL